MQVLAQQRLLFRGQPGLPLLVGRQFALSGLQRIEAVVEVAGGGVAVHHEIQLRLDVALAAEVHRLGSLVLALQLLGGQGVARVHALVLEAGDGDVHVVGGVEPAAPEPVEVHTAGILHGAEEVGGRGMLELPAFAIGLEGVVEELAAHHRFAQNVERRAGLPVGVVAELRDALAVGHDGLDARLLLTGRGVGIPLHVIDDVTGLAAPAGVVLVPLLLGEVLHEGVEALVHPGPLALIGVDDHGEEVVPHLVRDHADHAILRPFAVGAVLLGPPAVEADHRVLHADAVGMHTDGHRVGVVDGVLAVGLDGVRHHLGAVLLPQGIAFLGVEAHAEHVVLPHRLVHTVPDELAAAGEGHVAHVLCLEHPGLLA